MLHRYEEQVSLQLDSLCLYGESLMQRREEVARQTRWEGAQVFFISTDIGNKSQGMDQL